MKKFHIKRLEKLYDFLGTVKPQKFDFGTWGFSQTGKTDVNVCGTTACALGWAASMPAFRKRGLKLEWETYGWEDDVEAEADVVLYDENGHRVAYGDDAGAAFFGLSESEAEHLFIPGDRERNMQLGQYRQRLRKFINAKKRELKVA